MSVPLSFERDLLRAYQYLYYVEAVSLITDYEFDMLERAYEERSGEELPVGSDSQMSYTLAERFLAAYLKVARDSA